MRAGRDFNQDAIKQDNKTVRIIMRRVTRIFFKHQSEFVLAGLADFKGFSSFRVGWRAS
jgi:hypothetical protein